MSSPTDGIEEAKTHSNFEDAGRGLPDDEILDQALSWTGRNDGAVEKAIVAQITDKDDVRVLPRWRIRWITARRDHDLMRVDQAPALDTEFRCVDGDVPLVGVRPRRIVQRCRARAKVGLGLHFTSRFWPSSGQVSVRVRYWTWVR